MPELVPEMSTNVNICKVSTFFNKMASFWQSMTVFKIQKSILGIFLLLFSL